jgi:hypothetical protein
LIRIFFTDIGYLIAMKQMLLTSTILITALGLPSMPVLAQKLIVSSKDCRRLVRHVARDDVTYRAGVDVRGRKLKGPSADISGNSQVKGPTIIEFDVTRDLRSFLGSSRGCPCRKFRRFGDFHSKSSGSRCLNRCSP